MPARHRQREQRRKSAGPFVLLALNLSDAWNFVKKHEIPPQAWIFPRDAKQAATTTGTVLETRAFSWRPDADTIRAAVAHLPRETR